MNKRKYWKYKAIKDNLSFRLKRMFHSIVEYCWKVKYESPFLLHVCFEVIKQVFVCGVVAFLLYIADSYAINKLDMKINSDAFFSFLLSGLSVTGIILGLYCSNIISIYSSVYVNAPARISELFQRDIVTDKSIKSIISYIILNLIMLIEHVVCIQQSYVSLSVLSLYIIYVIIYYSKTRNRALQLSNSYSVSQSLYVEITKSIKRVSKGTFFSQDANYQAFYQKKAEQGLQILSELAKTNIENQKNRNSSMLEFMKNNLNLLAFYWEHKCGIPFDSVWYKDKVKYKQWHHASDQEIDIALRTGTSIKPSYEKNDNWFEEALVEINSICFDRLCETRDYRAIYEYLYSVAILQEKSAAADALLFSLQQSFSLQQKIQSLYKDASKDALGKTEAENSLLGIVEVTVRAYTGIILGINKLVNEISIPDMLKNATSNYSYSKIDFSSNSFLNNFTVKDLYKKIEAEIEIEKVIITPEWHIHQVVAQIIYTHLCEMIEIFNRIANVILPSFGMFFQKDELYDEAMLVYTKMEEIISKEKTGSMTIGALLPELLAMHKEPNVVWQENPFNDFNKATRKTVMSLPKSWMECSSKYAVHHWTRREEHPDLLGFCYNNYCEYLISSIEENDFEKFNNAFPDFLKLMLLYQVYIRNDLLKIKEKYRQRTVFHVWTAPFFEYALISGLAIIWGELVCDESWYETVDGSINEFARDESGKPAEILDQWCDLVMQRQHDIFGIGNRDVINTGWKMRIANAIDNLEIVRYEYGRYGEKTLKTNSDLLKAFCGRLFERLELRDAEDVFFIECLNKHLPPDKKYKSKSGWERRLNNE